MTASSTPIVPPPAPTPIERLLSPFGRFMATETSGGIVLLVCTAIAVIWANSAWAGAYHHLWETEVTVGAGAWRLAYPLHHWINDGLMVVFFFMVGLEIKREVLVGELASPRKAALPIAGALGGMLVPAAIYTAFNAGGLGERGWGIPMATDIAFALGVLALLGPRTPVALKVFLAALAIADDIGAVLVIAVFYTEKLSLWALGLGLLILAAMALANRLGVRRPAVYAILGVLVWLAFLKSGVHATVAGVLAAMTIPARTRINTREFLDRGRHILDEFDRAGREEPDILTNRGQQAAIAELEKSSEAALPPLLRIEHGLQPYVAFGIVPLFALANAGVELHGGMLAELGNPVTLGVLVGLLIGKPIGITLFAWLAVRMNLASLPDHCTWKALHAVAWLGGIGFTMSLFVTNLAFPGHEELVNSAKLGIFTASILAALIGWQLIRRLAPAADAVP
jgi:Na+:H+ antiporter, NhaA family